MRNIRQMKDDRRQKSKVRAGKQRISESRKFRKYCYVTTATLLCFSAALIYIMIWGYHIGTKGGMLIPVKKVVFIGNKHLSDNELITLSGLTRNGAQINLSPKSIRENLMKSPWIKNVFIRRDIHDVLKIKVHETEPLAILEMNGKPFLVDGDGRLLEELRGEAIPFIPVILSDPFKNKECFSEAINLARVLRRKNIAKVRNRVEIIAMRDRENMSVVIDGVVIKVGYGNYDEKFERFFELEDEIRKKAMTVEYIDLRFSNKAIVKPVKEVVQ